MHLQKILKNKLILLLSLSRTKIYFNSYFLKKNYITLVFIWLNIYAKRIMYTDLNEYFLGKLKKNKEKSLKNYF